MLKFEYKEIKYKNNNLKFGGTMSFSTEKRESMKRYMLEKIRMDDEQYIAKTAENFQISVTSVKRYIAECIADGIIEKCDEKATGYRLITKEDEFIYFLKEQLWEDKIYYTDIFPLLKHTSPEAQGIWSYSFMEMMNNAIEHSQAEKIYCHVKRDYLFTEISIVDDGIGIFRNIQNYFKKEKGLIIDCHDAILELHKGKFTTNPRNHSGEGIFFTSKVLREFVVLSDAAYFSAGCAERDKLIQSHLLAYFTKINHIGTMIVLKLENQTTKKRKEVFDLYAPVEDGFVKTYIPLKEVCPYGEPIARSQARRVAHRLEEFRQVELDFAGIDFMGQGFADEIFRVFQNQHPEILLIPKNANEAVLGMIQHVRANLK